MFTVYLLFSEKHNKIYVGFTSNLEERMKSHNELGSKGFSSKYRPWTLIYTENFEDKTSAMRREKQLKSANGRFFCWNQVNEFSKK